MADKKIQIGYNHAEYDRFKKLEEELFSVLKELQLIADRSLGVDRIDNYKLFLDDPKAYLIIHYWNFYCEGMPQHLNKEHIFQSQTRINLSSVERLKNEFWRIHERMQQYKPIIDSSGVHSTLKADSFNIYLDDSKKDLYNALNGVLEAIENVKKVGGKVNPPTFLQKLIPDIVVNSTEGAIIDITNFKA